MLHVEATEASGVAVGGLLLAQTLPMVLGPFAGTLADRIDPRRLMIFCDLGQAVVFAVIALTVPPFPILLALVAVTATLATAFRPAGWSSIPSLVRENELIAANAWLGTSLNVGVAMGPLVGGVLFVAGGFQLAMLVDAATFLISATFLFLLPSLRASGDGATQAGFFATTREGLSFARHHDVTRAVVLTLFLGLALSYLDNVALVFLTKDELGAGSVGFGAATSAFGIGMAVVSIVLIRSSQRFGTASLYVFGFVANGIGNLLTGLSPVLAFAITTQVLAGTGNGMQNVADTTLIQQTVPKEMLGRALGLSHTAAWLGSGLAYAAGGVIVDLTSSRFAFVVSGVGVLAVAVLAKALLPAEDPVPIPAGPS